MEHRLVHLDLKGAPPKISYYEQIFPLFNKWGATGLLVEYEDTFPFTDELADIAAPYAYTKEDIMKLQQLSEKYNFDIIPLVQTFGHFEFVLKHDKFQEFREIPIYPMTLCPLNKGSLELVKQMIDQVVQLHPHIKYFHIGADEVFHVGVCTKCHHYLKEKKQTKDQLFFYHIKKVLQYVKCKYPHLNLIMWDDMFRNTEAHVIKECGIGDLVEPMVWLYHRTLESLPEDLWFRYNQVFDNIWVASAFKGATGPSMFVTDIALHVENQRSWLKLVNSSVKPVFKSFRGYALTGWQRYDHYSVLCELLPVGLPSLAVCLLTITKGTFTEAVHTQASEDLGFDEPIPLTPFKCIGMIPACNFPGSEVYTGALQMLQLKEEHKQFVKNDRLKGWMSTYHVRCRYANPAHLQHFYPAGKNLLQHLQLLETHMSTALSEIFHPDTVEEWITTLLTPRIEDVSQILQTASELIAVGARPRSQLATSVHME